MTVTDKNTENSLEMIKKMTLEGFQCIQSFFILINEMEGKLVRDSSN
jgi:hypothetical protein